MYTFIDTLFQTIIKILQKSLTIIVSLYPINSKNSLLNILLHDLMKLDGN